MTKSTPTPTLPPGSTVPIGTKSEEIICGQMLSNTPVNASGYYKTFSPTEWAAWATSSSAPPTTRTAYNTCSVCINETTAGMGFVLWYDKYGKRWTQSGCQDPSTTGPCTSWMKNNSLFDTDTPDSLYCTQNEDIKNRKNCCIEFKPNGFLIS